MAMLNYRRVIILDHLESRWHNGTTPKKVEGMYMGGHGQPIHGSCAIWLLSRWFFIRLVEMIQFDKSVVFFFSPVSCCFCLKTKEARGPGLCVREWKKDPACHLPPWYIGVWIYMIICGRISFPAKKLWGCLLHFNSQLENPRFRYYFLVAVQFLIVGTSNYMDSQVLSVSFAGTTNAIPKIWSIGLWCFNRWPGSTGWFCGAQFDCSNIFWYIGFDVVGMIVIFMFVSKLYGFTNY